jgi:hypothetical protein
MAFPSGYSTRDDGKLMLCIQDAYLKPQILSVISSLSLAQLLRSFLQPYLLRDHAPVLKSLAPRYPDISGLLHPLRRHIHQSSGRLLQSPRRKGVLQTHFELQRHILFHWTLSQRPR